VQLRAGLAPARAAGIVGLVNVNRPFGARGRLRVYRCTGVAVCGVWCGGLCGVVFEGWGGVESSNARVHSLRRPNSLITSYVTFSRLRQ
jgi:hypothetical protein